MHLRTNAKTPLARRFALALVLGLAPAAVATAPLADAAPADSKVGDVRVVYAKVGTTLRAEPVATSAPAGPALASGTRVTVEEVKFPWLRVRSQAASGVASVTGWLKAFETVEAEAFNPNPPPPSVTGATGRTSQRDVEAASRTLSAETEKGYRASKPELARAYGLVDRMEAETQRLDPVEAVSFILEGEIGRRGRTYGRPGRLPPDPVEADDDGDDDGGGGGGIPDLPGPFGKIGKKLKPLGKLVKGARQAQRMSARLEREYTPEQEYWLGRAVAANAIAKSGLDPDEGRRHYVRLVGEAVVRLTQRLPANFGGYHFDVLDSDEVNGVAGPGGFVLLTRGAVLACKTEDELAGLLAHELAHVALKHGERVLRSGKNHAAMAKGVTSLVADLTGFDKQRFGGQLVKYMGEAVGEMARNAGEHRYGRSLEFAADAEGTQNLYDVFYDWTALQAALRTLATRPDSHAGDADHAPAGARADALDGQLKGFGAYPMPDERRAGRAARFAAAMRRAVGPR